MGENWLAIMKEPSSWYFYLLLKCCLISSLLGKTSTALGGDLDGPCIFLWKHGNECYLGWCGTELNTDGSYKKFGICDANCYNVTVTKTCSTSKGQCIFPWREELGRKWRTECKDGWWCPTELTSDWVYEEVGICDSYSDLVTNTPNTTVSTNTSVTAGVMGGVMYVYFIIILANCICLAVKRCKKISNIHRL